MKLWGSMLFVWTCALASLARGQIYYQLNFDETITQTKDGVGTLSNTVLEPYVATPTSSTFSSVSLTVPGGTTYQLTEASAAPYWVYGSYPGVVNPPPGNFNPSPGNGVYQYTGNGTINTFINAEGTFPDALGLQGESFENLEQDPTDQPITVAFNAVNFDSSARYNSVEIEVLGQSQPIFLAAGTTSYTFAADTFHPGGTNEIVLITTQGYGPATDAANYSAAVVATFTTAAAPEPPSGTLLAISILAGGIYVQRSTKSPAAVT